MTVGSRAAAAVAGRAGIGARALRADIEEAAAVDPGDRAAAGRDRGHVERRHVDLAARDHALGRFQRHAALDEGDVGAGAAHVERDEAGACVSAREIGARLRAGGGSGEQRVHGAAAGDGGGERHHAAVRLHQEALLRIDAGSVEAGVEMVDVTHHHRLEIGVEQRRRHPRPFADARQHLARQRDVHAGKFLEDERARLFLMRGIHEREQITDRDRLDAARPSARAQPAAPPSRSSASEHVAGVVGALGDFAGQALRRDRRGLGIKIIEQVAVARLVLHLLHGAIALGDQQARPWRRASPAARWW